MAIVITGQKLRITYFSNGEKEYYTFTDSVFGESDGIDKFLEPGYKITKTMYVENVIHDELKKKKFVVKNDI